MAWGAIAAAAAPTLIGYLAGEGAGQGSQTTYTTRNVAAMGANEAAGGQAAADILRQLQQFQSAGPGQQDVAAGYGAQNQLAAMLQQFSQGGYAPNAQDQELARMQLAPQFEQARQSQVQAQQDFRQTAARSGRGPMDFAFTNRLNQNTANQMQMLSAQQSQLAAQQPMQRLGFMQDFASVKQGLASQAMQNRMAIANLGSSIRDAGANFRLSAAGGTSYQTGQQGSQQGNMLTGALAGLGSGLKLYNQFSGSANNNFGTNSGSTGSGGYLGASTNF